MFDNVKRFLAGTSSTLYECRRCGTEVDAEGEPCPRCGSSEIATYRLS